MTSQKVEALKIASSIALLGILVMFKPSPCLAQAEINPDHYDTPSVDRVTSNISSAAKPRSDRSADGYRGKFVLPFDVTYAGVILPQGSYSVRVRLLRKSNSITLIPNGSAVRVQAMRVRLLKSAGDEGPSALVLKRKGDQRTLTAIHLKEPRIALTVQPEDRQSENVATELIPITFTVR